MEIKIEEWPKVLDGNKCVGNNELMFLMFIALCRKRVNVFKALAKSSNNFLLLLKLILALRFS